LKTKLSSVSSYLETSQKGVSNNDPLGDDPWWEYGAMNDEPWNASGASRSMTTIESLRYYGDSYFSSRRTLNPYGFMEAAHDQQVYERIAYETAVRDMMAGRTSRDDFREEWGDYFVGRFQSKFTMTEATQLAKFIDPKYNLFDDIVLNPDMANPNSVVGGYLLYSGMDAEVLTREEQFARSFLDTQNKTVLQGSGKISGPSAFSYSFSVQASVGDLGWGFSVGRFIGISSNAVYFTALEPKSGGLLSVSFDVTAYKSIIPNKNVNSRELRGEGTQFDAGVLFFGYSYSSNSHSDLLFSAPTYNSQTLSISDPFGWDIGIAISKSRTFTMPYVPLPSLLLPKF